MNTSLKLQAGKTYRLIDKEGYCSYKSGNSFYLKYFKDDCITLDRVSSKGFINYVCKVVIDLNEIKFFEEVEETKLSNGQIRWNGKTELKQDMLAYSEAFGEIEILFKTEKTAFCRDSKGSDFALLLTDIKPITEEILEEKKKEDFFKEVATIWQSQSFDFAFDSLEDTLSTKVRIQDVLELLYKNFDITKKEIK